MEQRVAIKDILEDEWFKNEPQSQELSASFDDVSASFSVCSSSKTF